jgi:SAM-dependent MidA family methyltransferase
MHPNRLQQIIREQIQRDGPIAFETFMNMGLYYPGLGYYMTPRIRIGPEGDFYTSPHLHSIFGRLLAVQLDEVKRIMGAEEFTILEVGAGRGYLADGIIGFIRQKPGWKENWRYIIVEGNPFAAEDQKKKLDCYKERIVWKSSLEEVDCFRGCVVTNEVLDAFPVHLVVNSGRFQEIYVGCKENGFTEVYDEPSRPDLSAYIEQYRLPKSAGYRTEINLRIFDYLKSLEGMLSEGFVITVDYGYPAHEYYAEERHRGTLLCYHRHRMNENPYLNVGKQDITAHVNFTSLRDWGNELGLRTIGYCPQGLFLASLGIDEIIAKELQADPDFHKELLKIKTLLFDMGESHHVMIQYKGDRDFDTLKGFRIKNRLNRL